VRAGTDHTPQILVNLPPDIFRDLRYHTVPFLHHLEMVLILGFEVRFIEFRTNVSTSFPLLETKFDLRGMWG
jgi:hypothetical protein